MGTKILCCRNLEAEVRLAMKNCGCSYPLEVLSENDHDVPARLRQRIQEKLDHMDGADRVLLAFTTCGGAAAGLRSGDFQLVIPRTDDCLSLLLGSMERRKAMGFGLFLTKGWLEHEKSIPRELLRIREKYPPARAEKIIRTMYGHFDSLNVIDTGAYEVAEIIPRTQALAQQLGLAHRVVLGSLAYLEELLQETHDPLRFLIIPPRSTVQVEDTLFAASNSTK